MVLRDRVSFGSTLALLVAAVGAGCAASQRVMPVAHHTAPVARVGGDRGEPAQPAGPLRAVCAYRRGVPAAPASGPAAPAVQRGSSPAAAVDHAPSAAERPLADREGPLPLSHWREPRRTDCGMGMTEVLRRRVASERDALRACYDAPRRPGGPAVEQRLVIRVTWANDGNVEQAEVLDALFDEDGAVSRCVANRVACWHVLPLGCDAESRVTVNFPLRFADAP